MKRVNRSVGFAAFMLLSGCREPQTVPLGSGPLGNTISPATSRSSASLTTPAVRDPLAPISPERTAADRIVNGAKAEVRRGVVYDASYCRLAYPGGDVLRDRGACTDVVIRAFRAAGIDLQQRIHEDMKRHFNLYPHIYGLSHPDANIDHRRTTNQVVYLRRFGKRLPTATMGASAAAWQPGDIVYWQLNNGLGHCGVLSNVRNAAGLPLVIHNIGRTAQEDCLTVWKITGHYRYPITRR